ncbi:MAG TPA: ATP-binding protein [Thermoanaerobaculia bacterium]|nr:ATP-binding protein [Thermoanaerobaculia bacterium]
MSLLDDLLIPILPPPPFPKPSREAILRELRASFAAGVGVRVISGPAGIGKTHLARRLQAELAPTTRMVWARGTAWGRPFQPLREAAESLRLWPLEEPALPRELAGVPAEVRERETWISLFRKRGQDGPLLVLCCDDLDSFDAPSWECVREMLRRRERLTVSLLLLTRTGPSRLALDVLSSERPVEVPPLNPEELAACCQERMGGPPWFEHAFPWLREASGGNPRHLLEILGYLRDTERLVPSAMGWRRAPESSLDVPCFEELVRRRLEAALAREKPETRSWIERGAVLGSRMEVPPAVAPALERVGERTGYLEHADERPDSFRFADQRVREAVRMLCEDRRPALDEGDPRLAALLEEEGKWHQAAEETAVAASEALHEEMPSEAARLALWMDRFLGRAGEAPDSPARLAAAEIRARALLGLGRYEEIVDHLGPRADGAFRAGGSGLLYLLGTAARLAPPPTNYPARRWLEQARQLLGASADPAQAARIQLELALVQRGEMDERTASRIFSKLQDLATKAKDVPLQLQLARRSRLFLEPGLARVNLEQALKQAGEAGLELEEALCHNNLAVAFYELGLLGVAEYHARACLEVLEPYGPWGTAVPLNNLGLVAAARGEWDRAGELLDRAGDAAGEVETDLWVRCNQAMVRATQGAPGVAADHLRHLAVEAGRSAPLPVRQAILFNLARALLESGEAAEALAAATVPPPWLPGDEDLARDALASLRLKAVRQSRAGRPEKGLLRQSRLLDLSTKPQAWIYRTLWARGDLLFL